MQSTIGCGLCEMRDPKWHVDINIGASHLLKTNCHTYRNGVFVMSECSDMLVVCNRPDVYDLILSSTDEILVICAKRQTQDILCMADVIFNTFPSTREGMQSFYILYVSNIPCVPEVENIRLSTLDADYTCTYIG